MLMPEKLNRFVMWASLEDAVELFGGVISTLVGLALMRVRVDSWTFGALAFSIFFAYLDDGKLV